MTTKDILNQMEKEFDEKFRDMKDSWNVDVVGYDVTKQDIKSIYLKHIRTLLESFGEEIIGEDENLYSKERKKGKWDWRVQREEGGNEEKHRQRLKVKEIISQISK